MIGDDAMVVMSNYGTRSCRVMSTHQTPLLEGSDQERENLASTNNSNIASNIGNLGITLDLIIADTRAL